MIYLSLVQDMKVLSITRWIARQCYLLSELLCLMHRVVGTFINKAGVLQGFPFGRGDGGNGKNGGNSPYGDQNRLLDSSVTLSCLTLGSCPSQLGGRGTRMSPPHSTSLIPLTGPSWVNSHPGGRTSPVKPSLGEARCGQRFRFARSPIFARTSPAVSSFSFSAVCSFSFVGLTSGSVPIWPFRLPRY